MLQDTINIPTLLLQYHKIFSSPEFHPFVYSGDMDISLLYLKDKFTFSLTLFGYLKGLDNFLRGLVMITFVPIVKKLTRVRDLPLVMFGLLSYAVAFILVGAAYAKWMVFLGMIILDCHKFVFFFIIYGS